LRRLAEQDARRRAGFRRGDILGAPRYARIPNPEAR
jgi:hypothetical protein